MLVLFFKLLHFIDDFRNGLVQLGRTKIDVEHISMVTARDHTLPELGSIFSDDVFDAFVSLEASCTIEGLGNDFVGAEIAHSSLKKRVLSVDFDNVIDKTGVGAFEFGLQSSRELSLWNVFKDQHVSRDLLLSEEVIDHLCGV